MKWYMNLHLFEGGAGAGAAPAAGGEGGGEAAVTPGMLDDGTQVDDRLAARMEEQARKRKARGDIPAKQPQAQQPQQQEQPRQEPKEPSLEDQWNEARNGKFKDLYGRDVQNAVRDRFKNQEDLGQQLEALEPMLKVLRDRAGVENNDDLVKHVLDDDSLYEEEAEERGMTVEGLKAWKAMERENERLKAKEQQDVEEAQRQQHIQGLVQQAEELKKTYPDFDLAKEVRESELFRRLTMPGSGVSVEAAYYAVHHKELEPQTMAYGIQKAQQQISQTLQANAQRPVEGAMRKGQPAEISVDPRQMKREERQKLIERARRGETIIF